MCPIPVSTERCTSSETLTSSRKTSTDPASARDISSRSLTIRWNRRRSSLRSWSARCDRAGSRSRSVSRTPTAAESVVSGERNSWLTSELNRASRSMRTWSWSTIALKEAVSPTRSGSAASMSSRVSSSPPAMAPAAEVTSESGRNEPPLAKRPSAMPSSVVTAPATKRVRPSTLMVWSRSDRSNTSK